jgi:hypothetical protein
VIFSSDPKSFYTQPPYINEYFRVDGLYPIELWLLIGRLHYKENVTFSIKCNVQDLGDNCE